MDSFVKELKIEWWCMIITLMEMTKIFLNEIKIFTHVIETLLRWLIIFNYNEICNTIFW
jgi:hypothetical protein